MIRVLHFAGIINSNDFIDSILRRLDRSVFEVAALVGTPPRRVGHYSREHNYPVRVLGMDFNRRHYGRMLTALLAEIRSFRPDVVHSHHFDETVVAAVASRVAAVPAFVIGHHYSDHIYRLTRGLKRRAFLGVEALCNRAARKIVVPAVDVAEILTHRQGLKEEKVEVIPYCFDLQEYRPSSPTAPGRLRQEFGLGGRFMVLSCCRLSPEKGLQHLLDAVPLLGDLRQRLRIVLVGSGPAEQELRQQARRLAIEDVVSFVGWRNDALDWIAAADLVVQPSFAESFCQVLFEGLALERPLIMTPVGAAPEILGQDERGLLVPAGNTQALAEAIRMVVEDYGGAREKARRGREFLLAHHSVETVVGRHERLYQDCLARVER